MAVLHRFNAVPDLKNRMSPLDREAMITVTAEAVELWRSIKQYEPMDWRLRSLDISNMEPNEVRGILHTTELPRDGLVRVIWPFEQFVVRMHGPDVITYFDDLWHPSRDDLLIVNDDRTLIVEFSHEEFLTVGRRARAYDR
jgi:hypothetical protein